VQAQGEERRELAKRTVNRERAAHARPLFQLLLRLTLAMSLLAMLAAPSENAAEITKVFELVFEHYDRTAQDR
jgi:hypothetical protein